MSERKKITMKEIRNMSGLTQKEFSDLYGIPKRTIENWEEGKSTPPRYVLECLYFLVLLRSN